MPETTKPSDVVLAGFPAESGPPDFSGWFKNVPARVDAPAASKDKPGQPRAPLPPSSLRARPSDSGHGAMMGAALFGESSGLNFGTQVHEALASIEWLPAQTAQAWGPPLQEVLQNFLSHPDIAAVFRRPSPQAEVWRERSIACRLDGTTYSAQMDRVVLTPAISGQKGTIHLVDFKTDQGEPDQIAGRYKSQIEIYAKILAIWSAGQHEIIGSVATIRKPALVRVC